LKGRSNETLPCIFIAKGLSEIALCFCAGTLCAASPSKAVKTIFDTEMSSDCDGAGALAVLNHLADLGEAEILACVADAVEPDRAIAATMSAPPSVKSSDGSVRP